MARTKVLIVEDKSDFRKIYGDRLRFGGYDVVDAEDGVQALKILNSESIDIVMTDIMMPNKDGYELIADMKKDEKLKNIPIVVMSLLDQTENLTKVRALGATDYLVKGMVTPNGVLEKIQQILPANRP